MAQPMETARTYHLLETESGRSSWPPMRESPSGGVRLPPEVWLSADKDAHHGMNGHIVSNLILPRIRVDDKYIFT